MLNLPSKKITAAHTSFGTARGAHPYATCIPALGTMHGKEKAIGPAFLRHLGMPLIVCDFIDTDALGTFTGEVPRRGTMLDIAITKAKLACASTGRRLGIGSEGSFGPLPTMPFVAANTEVIVLYDRELDTAIAESVTSLRTNFSHLDIESSGDVDSFLNRVAFPNHAVVVGSAERWGKGLHFKGLSDRSQVFESVRRLTDAYPAEQIRIATDMRAHVNPSRMAVIRAAASRLARRVATLCPECAAPGFGFVELGPGLPCTDCQTPTIAHRTVIHGCKRCSCKSAVVVSEAAYGHASLCPQCNP